MKRVLQERRKALGYTQKSFAEELGVSFRTYTNIEQKPRMPRKKLMLLIMAKLQTDSIHLFDWEEPSKPKIVSKNIAEYMSNLSENKNFTTDDIKAIRKAIKIELDDRKAKNITIKNRTNEGKWKIYQRVSEILNQRFNKSITAEEVRLYKKCKDAEYTNRTGKTTWSIPQMREHYGFNKNTGEII